MLEESKDFTLRKRTPKQFFLRYSDVSGRHDFSLGSYPQLSLSQARKLAFETWQQIDSGKDPIREREEERKNKQRAAEKKDWLRKATN